MWCVFKAPLLPRNIQTWDNFIAVDVCQTALLKCQVLTSQMRSSCVQELVVGSESLQCTRVRMVKVAIVRDASAFV